MDPFRQVRVRVRPPWKLLLVLGLAACSSGPEDLCRPYEVEDETAYRQELLRQREMRERQYRSSSESPVPDSLRTDWRGLDFYEISPRHRVAGPLVRKTNGRRFRMATTTGELRPCREVGYFLVDVGGGPETLPVYAFEEEAGSGEEDLFLPFTDATTAEGETYPAGRYLNVVRLDRGRYLLDFNRAYNPYCAYGGAWDCPIAPEENRLEAAVTAGERGWFEGELSSEEAER